MPSVWGRHLSPHVRELPEFVPLMACDCGNWPQCLVAWFGCLVPVLLVSWTWAGQSSSQVFGGSFQDLIRLVILALDAS